MGLMMLGRLKYTQYSL